MNRRVEILDAVLDIFKVKGVSSSFTMTELASKLDIGKSTIYEYFDNKEDILTSALIRMTELVTKSILERNDDNDLKFEEALKAELIYLLDVAQSSHLLVSGLSPENKFTFSENKKMDLMCKMKDVNIFYQEKFNNLFLKGIKEGIISDEIDTYDEALVTSLVAGSIVRLSNKLLAGNKELDLPKYIDKLYLSIILILNNK